MADGPSLQGARTNNNPDPMSEYVRQLVDLRRQLNDVTGAILKSAGIAVSPDGMAINSALDVLGTLGVSGTANIDGPLNVTGDAVFSGDLAVPNGSITNDALVSPVRPDDFTAPGAGFAAAASTWTTVASATLTTPAGFTQAIVFGTGWWRLGAASTSTTAYLNGRVTVNGNVGDSSSVQIPAGAGGQDDATAVKRVTGLTAGQTFIVKSEINHAVAVAADVNNAARVSGVVLWLR